MAAAVVLEVPRRDDELVEFRIYNGQMWPDTGCDLAPKCLDCPFVKCRYDEANGALTMNARQTRESVERLTAAGKSPRAIAQALGVSLRTVFRARSRR